MVGNVVISEVDAIMYVVLSKVENMCLIWSKLVSQNVKRYQ
jgi:hypothetical protein